MGKRKSARPRLKLPIVGIVMGSKSDLVVMKETFDILQEFSIPSEVMVVSAHRTPHRMVEYAQSAYKRGLKIIVAGAGGAAHLPGMLASFSMLPVIGVPICSKNSVSGVDSLLSIVQMPPGVPVATVSINGGRNAGILAARFLSMNDSELTQQLIHFKKSLQKGVEDSIDEMKKEGFSNFYDL